ncbi:hypothetical protein [Fibrisoma limi]|uniref:hypothetical protein n=1 Tax=Fibrisoma limi TaxID=663275 RepID=UPI000318B149|nr:hypothetical protein [Fibrisoma limi]
MSCTDGGAGQNPVKLTAECVLKLCQLSTIGCQAGNQNVKAGVLAAIREKNLTGGCRATQRIKSGHKAAGS